MGYIKKIKEILKTLFGKPILLRKITKSIPSMFTMLS